MLTQMIGIRSIKSIPTLNAAQGHNFREHSSPNVDPSRSYLNETLVGFPDGMRSTREFLEKRIRESPYYDQSVPRNRNHHVGERTVKAVEMAFQVNGGELKGMDFERWKIETVRFCQDTFGKDNVPYIVLHMDETTPHIHALIIPMNSDGKLSFNSFGSSKKDFWRYHEIYNDKYVGKLGIDMPNRLYGQLSFERIADFREHTIERVENISLSPPREGESLEQYAKRANGEHVISMDGYNFAINQYDQIKNKAEALSKANRVLYSENRKLRDIVETIEKERIAIDKSHKKELSEREYDLKHEGKIELLNSIGVKEVGEINQWKADSVESRCIALGHAKMMELDPKRAEFGAAYLSQCVELGERELYVQNHMGDEEEHEF